MENLLTGAKILFGSPLSVLKSGVRAEKETYHKKKIYSKYKVESLPTVDILELFPEFEGQLKTYSFLEGTSLITDIMLLKLLAQSFNKCSYLEIGSWRGESLANVSDVTDDCTSVTLSEDEMRHLNFGEEFIMVHGVFLRGKNNISLIGHNSHTYDFAELNKKFDLIFIDGDHSYKGVLDDTKKVFQIRKGENSVIVWHDYGFGTEDVRHSVLNAILDGIPEDKHSNLYHISNTKCAVYMEGKQFNRQYPKFPAAPNKNFIVQLKAEKF